MAGAPRVASCIPELYAWFRCVGDPGALARGCRLRLQPLFLALGELLPLADGVLPGHAIFFPTVGPYPVLQGVLSPLAPATRPHLLLFGGLAGDSLAVHLVHARLPGRYLG